MAFPDHPLAERAKSWAKLVLPLAVASSMVVCSLVVLANPYPRGDLEDGYADHLRNTFSAWAFFHAGPRIFWEPIASFGPTVPARERHMIWGTYPVVYPPGMIVLFAPLGIVENLGSGVSSEIIARWAILAILVAAHLAVFAYARGLAEAGHPWFLRWPLVYWFTTLLILFSLNGEFDAAFLLPVILAFDSLRRGRPERTLVLLSIALFIHHRAIAFAPILAAAGLDCLRARTRAGAAAIAVSAVLVLASLATLGASFASLDRLAVSNPVFALDGVPRTGAIDLAVATAVPAAVLLAIGLPLVALQVAALGGFFLASRELMLWHLLVLSPLALFARPKGRAGVLLSFFLAGWIYVVYNVMDRAPDIRFLKDRIEGMVEASCGQAALGRGTCAALGIRNVPGLARPEPEGGERG